MKYFTRGIWSAGYTLSLSLAILGFFTSSVGAQSTYIVNPEYITTPTGPNQSYAVNMKVTVHPSRPPHTNQMILYSLFVFFNSSLTSLNSATNNTSSATAGIGLDNMVNDTSDLDGNPETDKYGVVQAVESNPQGWVVPGNAGQLNFTTTSNFVDVVSTPVRVFLMDNPGNGFFDSNWIQYQYNDDTLNPNPGDYSWTQTYFLPVALSGFSIE